MRFMSHTWSATKQRLHPQSLAEISRHSVLSGDRIRQCETEINEMLQTGVYVIVVSRHNVNSSGEFVGASAENEHGKHRPVQG